MSASPVGDTPGPGRFGALLRALRERAGLTQEELAGRAGLTTDAVSALERGRRTRPYPYTVTSLADALALSDDDRVRLVSAVPSRALPPRAQPVAGRPADLQQASLLVPSTSLIGREADVAAVGALLRGGAARLVTLLGPGGVGKTRLAVAVAQHVHETFPDGVATVALAPLHDPALVLPAIGRALGLGPLEGQDADAAVAEHLSALRLLLVLDNVEHLPAAAPSIARLVSRCPDLAVLATSRAPLRVRGEVERQVLPLQLPLHDGTAAVAAAPAVRLFVERACAVAPGFELTPGNAGAVRELCGRLAGIPLALELAAARVRALDPGALLARFDEVLDRAGPADLPERQRTLRATLDWSYALLDPGERSLFRRLSVFSGGWSLDAVEAVCAGPEGSTGVARRLEALVEHSLVLVGRDARGELRYGMLEPIAQYARSLLGSGVEARDAVAQHVQWCQQLAASGAHGYGQRQVDWLVHVEIEMANISAALEALIAAGSVDAAAQLGYDVWLCWYLRGHSRLGRRLMEAVLSHGPGPAGRIAAQITCAAMAFAQGDLPTAETMWAGARELGEQAGNVESATVGTAGVGLVALASGELDRAQQLFRAALSTVDQLEGLTGEWLESLLRIWLGTVQARTGDLDGALAQIGQGLALGRRRRDRLTVYIALYNIAQVAFADGDQVAAQRHLAEGLELSLDTGDLTNLAYFLDLLAVVEASCSQPGRVAVLLGAAQALRETAGQHVYGYYLPDDEQRARAAERAIGALGEEAYSDALHVGRSLDPSEAVAYAVNGRPRQFTW